MTRIVVLFNLKAGADADAYEKWARETDMPAVRGLGSVDGFDVAKVRGLLGGGSSPYAYVEIIDVADMDLFMSEIGRGEMPQVAASFQEFADNPLFLLAEPFG